ncbi:MAG TPA: hypothetical protein VJL59_23475 [Anaerolineales bacterium]|nr:hypothetical protein [Anaerolineales bacterium]
MHSRKILIALITLALITAACRPAFVATTAPPPPGTGVQVSAPTRPAFTPAPTFTSEPRTPAPTFDFGSYLLTQAYAQFTPETTVTPFPTSPGASVSAGSNTQAISATPTPPSFIPASVIFSEPINIPDAVNTAECKIRKSGDCAPSMQRGLTLFFTFKFGVRGSEPFQWGNAAVVISRDGQAFKWFQSNNGLKPPPEEDEPSTLLVGEVAEFQAGLENAQPGLYIVQLVMCRLTVEECNAGSGWQNVGGDAIQFIITR